MKTHAEFLEELRKELKNTMKWIWNDVPCDDMWTGGREFELGNIINKIEQFQAELEENKE